MTRSVSVLVSKATETHVMTHAIPLSRRHLLAGLGASAVLAPTLVQAAPVAAEDFGVRAEVLEDQTAALVEAMTAAQDKGGFLTLPPGTIYVANLELVGQLTIEGAPGTTMLTSFAGARIATIRNASHLVLRGIGFGSETAGTAGADPLLSIEASDSIALEQCRFANGAEVGVAISDAQVTISDCEFFGQTDAAIHAQDSRGLMISGNRIHGSGNAGIRIWRGQSGSDGSIVTGNRIADIDWRGGGNGQNGNGINVFNADEVIIASNHIEGCAFTAVRLNTTKNTQITGNTCLNSGEVAIFSEFGFSGSVIANNIVDGAATGISMTNMNEGGQIAVCTGNIVRNIQPASAVNPDTTPIGIAAEAEAAITGNTVVNVPGIAFFAGYGTFLRNVLISSNVAYAVHIGIGVSVVEDAGPVHIANNMIYDPLDYAMVGLRWGDVVETDLEANVDSYPNVTIG